MKQKKENRVALLLHWAGEQKAGCSWQFSIGGQWPLHYRSLHWNLQADGRHI